MFVNPIPSILAFLLIQTVSTSTAQTCTAPALGAGQTYVPAPGCPIGPSFIRTSPGPRAICGCENNCGYVCTPTSQTTTMTTSTSTTTPTTITTTPTCTPPTVSDGSNYVAFLGCPIGPVFTRKSPNPATCTCYNNCGYLCTPIPTTMTTSSTTPSPTAGDPCATTPTLPDNSKYVLLRGCPIGLSYTQTSAIPPRYACACYINCGYMCVPIDPL